MPLPPLNQTQPSTGASPTGLRPLGQTAPDEGGSNLGLLAGGAAAMGGLAWLGSKLQGAPGIMGKVGKVASYANAFRQQLMLSGLALPKSMLGNVGAGVNASIESGSMAPLKALLSGETLRDAATAFKTGSGIAKNPAGSASTVNLPKILSIPGRLMGATDEATQLALRRGGVSAKNAANETLQTPLAENFGKKFSETMQSPAASYLHPFRRTPFNQFIEGLKLMNPQSAGQKRLLATHSALGAVHGAATADDELPVSLPLGIAAAGRGGYPYGAAALIARYLAGGKAGGGISGSLLPVSEYGLESSLTDPTRPFRKPAALSAIDRVFGGQ